MDNPLSLSVYPDELAVCHFPTGNSIPRWVLASPFFAITRTPDELSIVCAVHCVPPNTLFEGPWRAIKVAGPLDFSLTGILAGLATVLANAHISIFAISTYETDYILVRKNDLLTAQDALSAAGYRWLP